MISRGLLAIMFACALPTFCNSPLRAEDSQMETLKEQLVGSWTLVSVATRVGTGSSVRGEVTFKDVQPYGPNPRGRLSIEQDGRFASTVTSSDAKSAADDLDAPAEFEEASGSYEIHPSRPKTVMFQMQASRRGKSSAYVEINTLTVKELGFRTIPWPGGSTFSSFVYRRAE